MGRTADRTARRKAQSEQWCKEFQKRKSKLKSLGYEVYLSAKAYGEESWCYRKDGQILEGLAWGSENGVVSYLEDKLNIEN
ncbi:hypothetical protein K7A41_23415 [Sphingobacterium sp. InxBP1]|uniref:hypothetical protein n=1 Tax=Sphingobacterium sp. InxBP1 TaxID=2870328 RepID=UPI0022434D5C|nr:hypothetical protein [Sphingobacterium sp. InxBP1]MCW8314195.1 hypothetical protein [Sphingobacterium sp. InxBP1]